jgi:hypothetical protein
MREAGMRHTYRVSRALLLVALVGPLIACSSSPVSTPAINGTWQWQGNGNPGGSSITLILATEGDNITGTGTKCGAGSSCNPGAITITGAWSRTSFAMAIKGGGGYVASYDGGMVSDNELSGTWTVGTSSYPVIFYREQT